MYCEIVVYHRRAIEGTKLAEQLHGAGLGQELKVADAYQRSQVYRGQDPYGSLFAHDASQHCFVILQKSNRNQSTFHLEGDPNVAANTLFEVVEEYARTLKNVLRSRGCPRAYRVSRLVIRPFENNFKESGFEGNLFTAAQAYKETNFAHEAAEKLATFATTFAIVRLGLSAGGSDNVKAGELTLAIAVLFLAVELLVNVLRNGGTIGWKRR